MEKEEKINFKRLTSVIKKNRINIVILLFVFTLCGYFYSYNMITPKYKSTSSILLASNNINQVNNAVTQTDVTLNQNLISTYGEILKSKNVLGKVINNLSLDITVEQLAKNVEIKEVKDTQIIEIGVINQSAIEARKIAEELNNVFIEEIKQIYRIDNVNIVDEASLEVNPYNINHLKDILVSFGIGIIASVIMIAIIYFFDTTVKFEEDIEEYVGLNVIGTVPMQKTKVNGEELIVQTNSKSPISEALRTIRTNISFTSTEGNTRSILFTSCNSGEGKSWITSNIAVAYAQSNKNVIIVDADMRKGRQHKIFNVSNENGLSTCLKEIKNNQDYKTLKKYIKETNIPKVHIITIGTIPPNPSELLLSNKMKELVHMLKCVYDVVIIDGTPCNLVSDSIPVSTVVDTTVLVAESRRTKLEDIKNVVKTINNANGNIKWAILNKKEIKNIEYGKGYYYGHSQENSHAPYIQSCTVKELIANRKEYIEEINEEISEKIENDKIDVLTEKISNLEDKLLQIPDMTLESYTKVVDDIRNIYGRELDKQKLANNIKNDILKNELVAKLENNNEVTLNILEKEIQKVNCSNEVQELINKINLIENTIKDNDAEDKIVQIISEMKEEQNERLSQLQNNKDICEKLQEIIDINQKHSERIEELDNSEFLHNILLEIETIKTEQDKKINELNYKYELQTLTEKVNSIEEKIANTVLNQIESIKENKNTNVIDTSLVLNNIVIQMQKLNEKYEKIDDIQNTMLNNKVEEKIEKAILDMQAENVIKMQELNNKEVLNNIIIQMQKLNEKYGKVEYIEKSILNNNFEEKIQELSNRINDNSSAKTEIVDNSTQIEEIMYELKKINDRYEKLAEKVKEANNIKEEVSNSKSNKGNIIDLSLFKNRFRKPQELTVEYGQEIKYEDLLDLAVEIYEIKSESNEKIVAFQ